MRTIRLTHHLAPLAFLAAFAGCYEGTATPSLQTRDLSADPVYVVSYRALEKDNDRLNNELELALETFQGCVNRDAPRLYIVHEKFRLEETDENGDDRPVDAAWLEALQDDRDVDTIVLGAERDPVTNAKRSGAARVAEVLTEPGLREHCDQAVLYNRNLSRLAVNNALTAAAANRAYVLDTRAFAALQDKGMSDIDVVADYRDMNWKVEPIDDTRQAKGDAVRRSALKALRWGVTHLLDDPRLDDERFGMSTGHFRSVNSADKSPKVSMPGLDLMVSESMFVTMVDADGLILQSNPNEELPGTQREMEQIFEDDRYDGGLAFGWWSREKPDLSFLGKHGVSSLGNGYNLSFWKHIEADVRVQKQAPAPNYRPNKVYVALSFSQGDAMGFVQQDNRNHLEAEYQGAPVREEARFGLMHNALLGEYAPFLANWMYQQATRKQWFMSKGFGYPSVSSMKEHGKLEAWLDKSRDAMEATGTMDMMIADHQLDSDNRATVRHIARKPFIRSVFTKNSTIDNEDRREDTEVWTHANGTPIFEDPVWALEKADDSGEIRINATVNRILASAEKRQFFWVFFRHRAPTRDLQAVYDALADHPDIVLVDTDQLVRVFQDKQASEG